MTPNVRPEDILEEIIYDSLRYGWALNPEPTVIWVGTKDYESLVNGLGPKVNFVEMIDRKNVTQQGIKIYLFDDGHQNELFIFLRRT